MCATPLCVMPSKQVFRLLSNFHQCSYAHKTVAPFKSLSPKPDKLCLPRRRHNFPTIVVLTSMACRARTISDIPQQNFFAFLLLLVSFSWSIITWLLHALRLSSASKHVRRRFAQTNPQKGLRAHATSPRISPDGFDVKLARFAWESIINKTSRPWNLTHQAEQPRVDR